MPPVTAAPPSNAPASSNTPAAVPGAPASGAPANTTPSPPTDGKPTLSAAYSALDEIAAVPPEDTTGKPGEADTGNEGGATGDEGRPGADEGEGGAQGKPGQPQPGQQPVKAKTIREAKDRAMAEAKDWRTKHDSLKAELEKVKADLAKPHPDVEKLTKEREELNKELTTLRNELKFSAFQRSPEYKQQYEKPFVDAYVSGQNKAASLKVVVKGKMDELTGRSEDTIRQGAKEDFDRFMQIADDGDAAEFASETWGSKAALMIYHRQQVNEKNAARINAIDEYQKNAEKRETEIANAAKENGKRMQEAFAKENNSAIEKYPQWFKPIEGDTKGNELLAKGIELADLAFSPELEKLPLENRIRVWSAVRNKSAGFDRLAYREKTLTARVAELEAKLKEYEGTEPPLGDGKRGQKHEAGGLASVDEQIDKMASMGT